MTDRNKKAKQDIVRKKIQENFNDFEEVINDLIVATKKASMPLLSQSFELSKAICGTYKKAWMLTIEEINAKIKK